MCICIFTTLSCAGPLLLSALEHILLYVYMLATLPAYKPF